MNQQIAAKQELDVQINKLQAEEANLSSQLYRKWQQEKESNARQKAAKKIQEEKATKEAAQARQAWLKNRAPVKALHQPKTTRTMTSQLRLGT